MDTNKSITHIPPALIWSGPHEVLVQRAIDYLQTIFCTNNTCNTCRTCLQIRDQQYHSIIWLYPEKQYTLEQINIIFQTIVFTLDKNKHFFFVLQKADFLPAACANRLLKPIEEPPPGYHFLLLSERCKLILPTIRSRCITRSFYGTSSTNLHPELFAYFSTTKKQSPIDFLKLINKLKINERESIELLDVLLGHWIKKYKNAVKKHNEKIQKTTKQIVTLLKTHIKQPPMPGSSKLLWKNLFLQMHIK